MMFTKKRVKRKVSIVIDNQEINEVSETKFLGITVDKNLNWKAHIENIYKKVFKIIGIIYQAKEKIAHEGLHTLYNAFILPHLTYCCEVWGNTYKTNLAKIISVQKRAIRLVNKANFNGHTESLFKNQII